MNKFSMLIKYPLNLLLNLHLRQSCYYALGEQQIL